MNQSTQIKAVATSFNILEKLKSNKSHWGYKKLAQSHENGFNYQFNTIMVDELEFAIYERRGEYFVLVDFFKNYDEACPHAKRIIDNYPDVKRMFQNRAAN